MSKWAELANFKLYSKVVWVGYCLGTSEVSIFRFSSCSSQIPKEEFSNLLLVERVWLEKQVREEAWRVNI